MVWSGGTYKKGNFTTNGWTGDASLGIGIEAGRHDTQDDDFANGINQCLNKDGTNAATGNLNLGSNKLTNVANATNAADAMAYGQIRNGTPLYLDTTNNRIGIGTTTPTSALQVTGAIDGTPDAEGVHIGMVGTTYACVELCGSTGGIIDFNTAGVDSKGRILYTHSTNTMSFSTNNVERTFINSNGDVGVGITPTAGYRLHIQGQDSGANQSLIVQNAGTAVTFQVRNDGLINTGGSANSPFNLTTASAANMVVASGGNLQRSTSSLKYKTDVQDATHGLAEVLQLRSVTYKGKNDGETIFGGLIAEEVDAIGLTEFVQYAEDETPDALAYGNMVSLAFKAIQQLNTKVEALEARIAELEA